MSSAHSPLRTHLHALACGEATAASARVFRAVVAGLLGRQRHHAALDDALQSWALGLVSRPRALASLLALDEPRLRAAIRRSLRRALTDLQPDWPLRKALAAWPAGESLPGTTAARTHVFVRWLMGHYFPGELPLEAGAAEPTPSTAEDEVRRRRDGLHLAQQVLEALGTHGAELLERPAHGQSLQAISRALGIPVATVHDRVEKAMRTLADVLDDEPTLRTWGAGMQALRMLRELQQQGGSR